jgi:hypothetical protein
MARKHKDILLLIDPSRSRIAADLDVLYPDRVERLDYSKTRLTAERLTPYTCVITQVADGSLAPKLNYRALTAYARQGGQVLSCLFEYAENCGLRLSKTHVLDGDQPGMRIEVECDVTRGFAVSDRIGWFGCVERTSDLRYENQMFQRQLLGVRESKNVRILATSTVNQAAIMVEEKVGKGRIVALDMLSPGRPTFNSHGSTNKYIFLANMLGSGVRYGKHYPKRLSYEEFADAMADLARTRPALTLQNEGPCSDGRPMWGLSLGNEANPTLYVGASIHGWEWENAYGVLRMAELLAEQPDVEGLNTGRLHFKFMPIQNPWGHEHFTRQNSHGVDLNRNFDCAWEALPEIQDVATPWDYNYKGPRAASERETQVLQRILDRHRPLCVIDFHTADYGLIRSHKGDLEFVDAIHANIKARLKDRFLCQRPDFGPFQQVNMDDITKHSDPLPYLVCYAAQRGTPAAFVIEMSGNRDGMHATLMNTETVVEICLAATEECLRRLASG